MGPEEYFLSILSKTVLRKNVNDNGIIFLQPNGDTAMFFMHKHPNIRQYSRQTKKLYVNDIIWNIFKKEYELGDPDIPLMIIDIMSKHIKLEVLWVGPIQMKIKTEPKL